MENMVINRENILNKLLEFSETIRTEELFPTLEEGASPLIYHDPYAFTLACCLDRGMPVEIIWTVPYYLKNTLGHLDPFKIYELSLDDLANAVQQFPKKIRYWKDAPRTIHELTTIVVEGSKGSKKNFHEHLWGWRGHCQHDIIID
jgi:hypothetical protein